MPKPPFIQNLLNAKTLWEPPVKIDVFDPVWQSAWIGADVLGKKNLARGWVWTAMTSDMIWDAMDEKLSFVQDIQKYLDPLFFLPYLDDYTWSYLSVLLGFESTPVKDVLDDNALNEAQVLRRFFFGSKTEQCESLLKLSDMDELSCDGIFNATCQQAWSIASDDNGDLLSAAQALSMYAGSSGLVPGMDLPDSAKHIQIGAYIKTHGANATTSNSSEELTLLKKHFNSMEPSVAVSLLLEYVKKNMFSSEDSYYIADQSFLMHDVENDDVYTVMKSWIPKRSAMFSNAESLGLDILDVCSAIVAETPTLAGLILPHELTP